jgi:hypothetical protein
MNATTKAMLARMPLAEAVLWMWRLITSEERMQQLWDAHRGRCYQKVITFFTIVQLIADALLQYSGSGRRSFEKSREQGELAASIQAAYRKLGRLPLRLSEAFLTHGTASLREMFPGHARRKLPRSLRRFQLVTIIWCVIIRRSSFIPIRNDPPARGRTNTGGRTRNNGAGWVVRRIRADKKSA